MVAQCFTTEISIPNAFSRFLQRYYYQSTCWQSKTGGMYRLFTSGCWPHAQLSWMSPPGRQLSSSFRLGGCFHLGLPLLGPLGRGNTETRTMSSSTGIKTPELTVAGFILRFPGAREETNCHRSIAPFLDQTTRVMCPASSRGLARKRLLPGSSLVQHLVECYRHEMGELVMLAVSRIRT